MSPLFDEAELLDRVDGDWAFLGETVEMLASDAPGLVAAVRDAMHAQDAAGVGRSAHALKGMIANFCAPVPLETAHTLERLGKAGDLSGAPSVLTELEGQVNTLTEQLQALVARGQ